MIDIKLNDPTIAAAGVNAPVPPPEGTSRQEPRDPLHASAAAQIAALIGRADDLADYASNLTGQLEKAVREYVPEDQRDGLYRDLRHYLTKAADAFDGMREVGVELDGWARRRAS